MYLFFLIQFFLLSTTPLVSEELSIPGNLHSYCKEAIDEVINEYFRDTPRSEIIITPLLGGHSNTCLKITINTRNYVLRIKDKETSLTSLKRELYAMQEGMNIGIAPQIFYISKDLRAVLMDFVETNTATILQTKEPENCAKIANTIRQAHNTKKNPYVEESINEAAVAVFLELAQIPKISPQVNEAIELMWEYTKQLDEMDSDKVNIHGELNPRNIFLSNSGAIFIDWEYTGWEDPFFDLSYLALRLDYDAIDEKFLLESYLQRTPTFMDLERYYLTKKIHLSQLCIYFNYFSLKFNEDQKNLDESSPLKNWSYYMKIFSDQEDETVCLAQFYYDLAKVCLNSAKE